MACTLRTPSTLLIVAAERAGQPGQVLTGEDEDVVVDDLDGDARHHAGHEAQGVGHSRSTSSAARGVVVVPQAVRRHAAGQPGQHRQRPRRSRRRAAPTGCRRGTPPRSPRAPRRACRRRQGSCSGKISSRVSSGSPEDVAAPGAVRPAAPPGCPGRARRSRRRGGASRAAAGRWPGPSRRSIRARRRAARPSRRIVRRAARGSMPADDEASRPVRPPAGGRRPRRDPLSAASSDGGEQVGDLA